MDAIIEFGVRANYDAVDETGLRVRKVSFKGKRDKIEKIDAATEMVGYVRQRKPQLTFTVNGNPIAGPDGNLQGICNLHPGNASTLLNFAGTDNIHGFLASANKLITFDDFTLDASDEEAPTDDMNFTLYPGIAAPAP